LPKLTSPYETEMLYSGLFHGSFLCIFHSVFYHADAVRAVACADIGTIVTTGNIALWTLISIGLFNSIMFPNIFTLAVKDLDKGELSGASGLINALIFGGAVIPPLMGFVADSYGYTWAFVVPAICYLFIFYYAVKGSHIRK